VGSGLNQENAKNMRFWLFFEKKDSSTSHSLLPTPLNQHLLYYKYESFAKADSKHTMQKSEAKNERGKDKEDQS
jgi:hypothetical protein